MTARQIQRIYGLGAKIGIVGNDRDDELHALVESLTGKESIKALDDSEYKTVVKELVKRAGTSDNGNSKPKKQHKQSPAGMTAGQQKKVMVSDVSACFPRQRTDGGNGRRKIMRNNKA